MIRTKTAIHDFTVKELAAKWRTSSDRVLRLIRAGELRAFDVSQKPGGMRKCYRIALADVLAFEVRRSSDGKRIRVRSRKRQRDDIIEFIK